MVREHRPEFDRRTFLRISAGATIGCIGTTFGTGRASADRQYGWLFEGDGGFSSSPTVVDGTVYVGCSDNQLYALDAATGTKEWSFDAGASIQSAPNVTNGTVYCCASNSTVYAVDAETGEKQWSFDTVDGIESSPVVADGTVYCCSRFLYALDAETGDKNWETRAFGTYRSPVVVGNTVYAANTDSHLYAVDANSGDERWKYQAGDPKAAIFAAPTVAGETVYFTARDARLYAVDARSGDERWTYDLPETYDTGPTVANETVYLSGYRSPTVAVAAESGERQWQTDSSLASRASPTVVGETVVVGDSGVQLFDATTGESKGSVELPGTVENSPTVVDGVVFLADGGEVGETSAVSANDLGIEGSSKDSQVLLGTEGHHDDWSGEMLSLPFTPELSGSAGEITIDQDEARTERATPTPTQKTPTEEETQANSGEDPDEEEVGAGGGAENNQTTGDSGPGFGVFGSFAGIGGLLYFLRHRSDTGE